jgi:hypothetical protein
VNSSPGESRARAVTICWHNSIGRSFLSRRKNFSSDKIRRLAQHIICNARPRMADSDEPKKETVRITVSPQPGPPAESRETVQIHLPTRSPANPPPSAPVALVSPARAAAAVMPAPMTTPAPKKETARIAVLPDPRTKPAVEMKKTQPLIDLPSVEMPATRVTVAPEPRPRINAIPMPLCWALLAGSAAILILQIWNYLS